MHAVAGGEPWCGGRCDPGFPKSGGGVLHDAGAGEAQVLLQ